MNKRKDLKVIVNEKDDFIGKKIIEAADSFANIPEPLNQSYSDYTSISNKILIHSMKYNKRYKK